MSASTNKETTSDPNTTSTELKPKPNMKSLLGYLNQSEWLYLLNIGNIM
jgi:hypothetical protein